MQTHRCRAQTADSQIPPHLTRRRQHVRAPRTRKRQLLLAVHHPSRPRGWAGWGAWARRTAASRTSHGSPRGAATAACAAACAQIQTRTREHQRSRSVGARATYPAAHNASQGGDTQQRPGPTFFECTHRYPTCRARLRLSEPGLLAIVGAPSSCFGYSEYRTRVYYNSIDTEDTEYSTCSRRNGT